MAPPSPNSPEIDPFMTGVATELGQELPPPKDVFAFGDSNTVLSDELLNLALQGKKTATTSWPIPDPLHWGTGDYSVILDGKGEPKALMRTLSLVKCMFKDVAEDFALAEAEGDYEAYREGHIRYYSRQPNGHEFGEESWVLCERFEIVWPKAE